MNPAPGGGRPRRWPGRLEPPVALALGALQTVAFVHTAAWPLPLLALAWLVWRLDRSPPRRAALLGWCYGTAWLCAGTWWMFISMHRYGGLPAPLAALAVLGLSAALSLYLAAGCAAYARWRRGKATDALLLAAVWLLSELARGVLFTGFPWVASGYSQVDAPLAGLAPWVGVYGIGAVLAFAAAALVQLLRSRGRAWPAAAAAATLTVAAGLPPSDMTQPAGELSVLLLQTNVAQDEKFAVQRMPDALAWVSEQLLAARADLVVAPETAIPLLPQELENIAPGYLDTLSTHFAAPGRAALVGIPLGDFERGYSNSVVGLQALPGYRYDKTHLVPFGEFIPTGFHWFTAMMNIPLGDFARGVANPPSFAAAGQRIGPNICYEDLFGEELARRFIDPALAPTVLANVSNLGWFGNTSVIAQHLNISRLRTLELQRPMLRATNTGATAVIDHRGQVTAALPPYTRGVLAGRVQGRSGTTPYAWWAARAGLWPLFLLAVLACLTLARPWRRAQEFVMTPTADLPPVAAAPRRLRDLPSPPGLPFVGQMFAIDRPHFHQQLEAWRATHGDLFRIRIAARDFLVVADPAVIATVLRDRPRTMGRTERLVAVSRAMGFEGVFASNGSTWQRQRPMVMAGFDPRHIKHYFPSLVHITQRFARRWQRAAGVGDTAGTAIDLQADLMRYTVDAIAGLAFGADVNTLEGSDDVIQRHLDQVLPALFKSLLAPVSLPGWFKTPADRRLATHLEALNDAVQGFIAQARARLAADPALRESPHNLIDAMLVARDTPGSGLTDRDVSGNVLTMLLAGEDTTANTLAWMIHLLARNPAVLARAQAEVRSVLGTGTVPTTIEQVTALDYVEACCHETMRLKPVAPIILQQAHEDTVVAGVAVPAKTMLILLMRAGPLDAQRFADPQRFDPTRWLARDGSGGADAGAAKRVAMPFGAGPRICPGRYLALMEMKMVMAMLLGGFDVDSVTAPGGGEAEERLALTMFPVGLRMTLRQRAAP